MPIMPRRSRKNADLAGTNLHTNGKYLYWKHPVTGKKFYLTEYTRQQAIQYARKANALVAERYGAKQSDHVPVVIDRFEAEYLPIKQYAVSTLEHITYKLRKLKKVFNGRRLSTLSMQDLNDYLAQFPPYSRKHERQVLVEIYRFGLSEGLCSANLAERTLLHKLPKRQRKRLTLEQFHAIYDVSDEWFQIAMLASLLLLQRRSDLVNIQLADLENGQFPVIQSKTGKAIKISCNKDTLNLFKRSGKTPIPSPYLIHRRPVRKAPNQKKSKSHWTQVTPEMLTRTFKANRDEALGELENPPTWYEIKSLGGRLLKEQLIEQGNTDEQAEQFVQLLMGHEDRETTKIYLENGIQWEQVETGLKL